MPVNLVGHNPDLPGVEPAADWEDLKRGLAAHRFLVHTAGPHLEDGFNMALMEGLAAGLPVIGNRHRSSPIVHGVSGFLSDDPLALRSFAKLLVDDHERARAMSAEALRLAEERFPPERFVRGIEAAIERARRRWESRPRRS
jgi:glycosyltransferase involved in cell wall biosynthesis